MKRLLLICCCMLTVMAGMAAAKIKFDTQSHDFGTIKADGGQVVAVYTFTNVGDEPLVVVSVTNGGCGCTKPSFTKEPVMPGKKGEVRIKFQPRGRQGEFNRQVKVKTNAGSRREKLTFSCVIIP